jgi:hypothetical protein
MTETDKSVLKEIRSQADKIGGIRNRIHKEMENEYSGNKDLLKEFLKAERTNGYFKFLSLRNKPWV